MRTTATLFGLALFALTTLVPTTLAKESPTPGVPNTATGGTLVGTVSAATSSYATFPAAAEKARSTADMQPVRLNIPSIGLNDPIQNMGVLKNGELAVPSGSTHNVGWYAAGTVPGEVGSAVLDAHVFAAFKNLHNVSAGDSIYVTDKDGTVLHFVVQTVETFKLGQLSANYLYNRDDAKRLTLITCAGKLTADHSTYDHRLVVSAVLVA